MRVRALTGWSTRIVLGLLLLATAAGAADLGGTYRSPDVTLKLAPAADGGYAGTLTVKGTEFPVTAREAGGGLAGEFTAAGDRFAFTAVPVGDRLTLRSGPAVHELTRDRPPADPAKNPLVFGTAATPATGPVNPLAAGGGTTPATQPATPATQPANPLAAQPANPLAAGGGAGPAAGPVTPVTQPTAPAERPVPPSPTHDAALAYFKRPAAPQQDPKRDWLIVVHMVADNNLDENGERNIDWMEQGMPDSGVEILVLADRLPGARKDGPERKPTLYRVKRDARPGVIGSEALQEFGSINSADPALMTAFVGWALRTYPARQHAFVAWDHGGGWQSLNHDENAGTPKAEAHMTLPAFRKALADGLRAGGVARLDLVLFDMCLMGQIEVAAEMADLADVMIASQELEPGDGVPWTKVVEAFGRGTIGGRRIATEVVAAFGEHYRPRGERGASTTMSALDLRQFKDVNAKLNAVCDKLIPAMQKSWPAVARSIFYAEQYNRTRDDFRRGPQALQSVDLLDALKKLRASVPDFPAEAEYRAFVQAADGFVLSASNSPRRWLSNGVAVYAPVVAEARDPAFAGLAFARDSRWPALLAALYPQQAANRVEPKFNRVALTGPDGAPAASVQPLSKYGITFEVEGTNLIWVRDAAGVRDPQVGGVRLLGSSYVIDPNFLQKMQDANKKFASDLDVVMPQLADGKSTLFQPQLGLMLLMSNGRQSVQVMADNSDMSDPSGFTVPALVTDRRLGDRPVVGMLKGSGVTMDVAEVIVMLPQPGGRVVTAVVEPRPDTKVSPLFRVLKDGGGEGQAAGEPIAWGDRGLYFHLDLLPPGEYEGVFTAETMTGVQGRARYKFTMAPADPQWAAGRDQVRRLTTDQYAGTWQWAGGAGGQLQNLPIVMTLAPTKAPFVYKAEVVATAPDGKQTVTGGLMIIRTDGLPSFHFMTATPRGMAGMMGPIVGIPREGVLRTMNISLNSEVFWVKKTGAAVAGGGGGGGDPAGGGGGQVPDGVIAIAPADPPEGWAVVGDARQAVRVAAPPGYPNNPEFVRNKRLVFPGYDFNGINNDIAAGFEIVRFDGERDPAKVAELLVTGAKQLGMFMQLEPPKVMRIDGVLCQQYGGVAAVNGMVANVSLILIPTRNGIVAVNLAVAQQTAQQAIPTFTRLLATVRVPGR